MSTPPHDRPNRPRNAGTGLQTDWFDGIAVNTPAAERRAATLTTRRTVKKAWQAAWLVNAIRCMDLTTLSGDDTGDRVARLCAKARQFLHVHEAILENRFGNARRSLCHGHQAHELRLKIRRKTRIRICCNTDRLTLTRRLQNNCVAIHHKTHAVLLKTIK